ncbi:Tenascin-X [Stylophora pistillata]|uniref:Tenascin-X n=1 Tax=Stylophora pistillata TaxID=50429 RepID=A0A2B4S505_STYPI|nr:Tenascin-X [Stylophora pistillata]
MVLTRNDSAYEVYEDLVVTENVTLTVQPGVTLYFQPGVSLQVEGSLQAKGDAHNRVVFSKISANSSVNVEDLNFTAFYNDGIRLSEGNSYRIGRLEIFINGQWGTVCDDRFDMRDAQVACRQLGFLEAKRFYTHGRGTGPIWLDDVDCQGSENSLLKCRGVSLHNCDHREDIGIECHTLEKFLANEVFWKGINFINSLKASALQYVDVIQAYQAIKGDQYLPDLDHVTIKECVHGVRSDGLRSPLTITESSIRDNQYAGMELWGSTKSITIENTAVDNTTTGVGISYNALVSDPLDFCSADVDNLTFPITLQALDVPSIVINNCTFSDNHGKGLSIHDFVGNISITSTNVFRNKIGGITVERSSGIMTVTDTHFLNNSGNGADFFYSSFLSYKLHKVSANKNAHNAMYFQGVAFKSNISNSAFSGNSYNGFAVNNGAGEVVFRNIDAVWNQQSGMQINNGKVSTYVKDSNLSHNGDDGCCISNQAGSHQFHNCTAKSNLRHGVSLSDRRRNGYLLRHQFTHFSLEQSFTTDNGHYGVKLGPECRYWRDSAENITMEITKNQIERNSQGGIFLSPDFCSYWDYRLSKSRGVEVTVTNNHFEDNKVNAFYVYCTGQLDVPSIVINNCTLSDNHGKGLSIHDFVGNISITSTNVFRNKIGGITVERSSGIMTVTDTHFLNNSGNGADFFYSSFLSYKLHKVSANKNAHNAMYFQGVAFKSNISNSAFSGNSYNGFAVYNGAGEVVFRNIDAVWNQQSGMQINNGKVSTYVKDSNLSHNGDDGCCISNQAGSHQFHNCTAKSNLRHGVSLSDRRRNGYLLRHQFTHFSLEQSFTTDNGQYGVKLGPGCRYWRDSAENITMEITKNQIERNSQGGIFLSPDFCSYWDYRLSKSRGVEVTVTNNHFEDNKVNAFYVYCTGQLGMNAIIESNTFINNTEKVLTLLDSNNCGARYKGHLVDVKINNNTFRKNRAENVLFIDFSSFPETRIATIRNNTFEDNDAANRDLFPNFFRRSTTRAVIVLKEGSFVLRDNILENRKFAFQLSSIKHDPRRAIDAKFNWWGTKEECGIVARIFDHQHRVQLSPVNFSPYFLSQSKTSAINSSSPRPFCFLRGSSNIGGILDRPLVLSAADSPYEVKDDIIVLANGTLTIPQNVTLRFPPRSVMFVQGKLLVHGTEIEKVRFTNKCDQDRFRLAGGAGPWEGRVEFLVNDTWWPMCLPYGRSFTTEGRIICLQLDLYYQYYRRYYRPDQINGFVHNIICNGNIDNDILNCSANNWRYEPTCRGYVVFLTCQRPNWAGLHLSMTKHQHGIQHFDILDAGLAYRSDIHIPGAALKIDLNRHNLSNIFINNSLGTGVQVVYQDLLHEQTLIPYSTISNTKSHGLLSRSPSLKLTDVNITRSEGNGFLFTGTWDGINTLAAEMASPDMHKTFRVCSENKTFVLADGVYYFTLETLEYTAQLRCQHVMETEPGYKLVVQVLYYSPLNRYRHLLHVYDGVNASAGSPWKLETLSWRDHPTFNSTKPSILFDLSISYYRSLAFNFLVYAVKASKKLQYISGDIGISRVKITRSHKGNMLIEGDLLTSFRMVDPAIRNSRDFGIKLTARRIQLIEIASTNLQNNNQGIVMNLMNSLYAESRIEKVVINGSLRQGITIHSGYRGLVKIAWSHVTNSGDRGLDIQYGHRYLNLFVTESTFAWNRKGAVDSTSYHYYGVHLNVRFQSNNFFHNLGPTVDISAISYRSSWVYLNNTFINNRGSAVIAFRGTVYRLRRPTVSLKGNLFMTNQCPDKAVIAIQREVPAITPYDVVNVTHNWWNTVVGERVRDRILDFDDNYDYAIADDWPFLLSSDNPNSTILEPHDFKQRGQILSGRLFESIALEEARSTYYIISDLTVLQNVTLTIEAGVTVKMRPGVSILVVGSLQVLGTPTKPIKFTVAEPEGVNENSRLLVRLVDGAFPWEGRAEVFHNDSWMPISAPSKTFMRNISEVVCRQLGYNPPKIAPKTSERLTRDINRSMSMIFRCSGNETSLQDCGKMLSVFNISSDLAVGNCEGLPWGNLRFISSRNTNASEPRSILQHVEFSHGGNHHGMMVPPVEAVLTDSPNLHSIKIINCTSGGLRIHLPRTNIHVNHSTFVNTGEVGVSFSQTRHSILVESSESSMSNKRGVAFEEASAENVPQVHYGRVFLCSLDKTVPLWNPLLLYFDIPRLKTTTASMACQKILTSPKGLGTKLTILFYSGRQRIFVYDSTTTSNLIVHKSNQEIASLVHKELFIPRSEILIQWSGDVNSKVAVQVEGFDIVDAPCTYELDLCGWQTFSNMSIKGRNVTTKWTIVSYNWWYHTSTADYSYFSLNGTYPTFKQKLLWEASDLYVMSWRKIALDLPSGIDEYRLLFEGECNISSPYYYRNYVMMDNVELRSCSHDKGEHRIYNSFFMNNNRQAIEYTSVADGSDRRPPFTFERCKITQAPSSHSNVPQQSAVSLKIQENNFTLANNFISGNRLGGIKAQLGQSDGTSLYRGLIYGNTFTNNANGTIMVSDGNELKQSRSFVYIVNNLFGGNTGENSTLKLRDIQSEVTDNFFYNNSGLHSIEYNFSSPMPEEQTCARNTLYLNKGLGKNHVATISSNGPMKYQRNSLKNPANLYELRSTRKAVTDPINAKLNWWGFGTDSSVDLRIYEKRDDYRLATVEYKPFMKFPPKKILSIGCPADWLSLGSACYALRRGSRTLQEAEEYCQHYGGHVASTSLPDDMEFINMATQAKRPDGKPPVPIWVATHVNPEAKNSSVQKRQQCTVRTHDRIQKVVSCDSLYPFVCTKTAVIRCPNGCFHKGDCVVATCFCYRGWTGQDCSQYHCNDVHNCSGNGECLGPNICKCKPGFLGRACSYSYCARFQRCSTCSQDPACGWCDSAQQCMPGTALGPYAQQCPDWFWYTCYTVGSVNHCSSKIQRVGCIARQCNATQETTSSVSCQKCKDLEKCYNYVEEGKCRSWNETRCPHGLVKVDYTDPKRINNTVLRSNVKVIDPNTTIIYSCPVLLPGRTDVTSVLILPRSLGIKAGDLLSSAQAGGVMHTVNETTFAGPFTIILGTPSQIEDVIQYADFTQKVSLVEIVDETTLDEEPNMDNLQGLLNGSITLNGSAALHVLPKETTVFKCVGHIYKVNEEFISSQFLVINKKDAFNVKPGDVVVSEQSHGFIEKVVRVSQISDMTFVETELERCTENSTWGRRFNPRIPNSPSDNDVVCTGGDNSYGLIITEPDPNHQQMAVNDSVVGRTSNPILAKVVESHLSGDFMLIEVLPVLSVVNGTPVTMTSLNQLLKEQRRHKRDIARKTLQFRKSHLTEEKLRLGKDLYISVKQKFRLYADFIVTMGVLTDRNEEGQVIIKDGLFGLEMVGEVIYNVDLEIGGEWRERYISLYHWKLQFSWEWEDPVQGVEAVNAFNLVACLTCFTSKPTCGCPTIPPQTAKQRTTRTRPTTRRTNELKTVATTGSGTPYTGITTVPTTTPPPTTPPPCECANGGAGIIDRGGNCDCPPECPNGKNPVIVNNRYKCPVHPPCGEHPSCVMGRIGPGCTQADVQPCSAGCSGNGVAISTPDCGSRCVCWVRWTGPCCETRLPLRNWGDPHIETLDGIEFDYFGIGEFWGCKSPLNDFGIQFRYFAYQRASLTGGVAIKAGLSVLSIMTVITSDSREFPKLRLDGILVNISAQAGQKMKISYGTVVMDIQRKLKAESNETAVVLISLQYESGRITTVHKVSGLQATWSWNSSNFHSADVMDYSYHDPNHVPMYSLDGIDKVIVEEATKACLSLGLSDTILQNCIYDLAVTNDSSLTEQEILQQGCPDQCSGKGRCVNSTCQCMIGWSGESCQLGNCSDCNMEHGRCVKGFCECDDGWEGVTCDQKATCYSVNNCTSANNGICQRTDQCRCHDGYIGQDCSVIPTCSKVSHCSGRGICIDYDVCKCNRDWTGDDCTQFSCGSLEHCSNHGRCVALYKCDCNAGWTGVSCALPDCAGVNQCSGQGECVSSNTCRCYPGFQGANCSDLVSCANLDNCNGNGVCMQEENDVNLTCRCYAGFRGSNCNVASCPLLNNCSGHGVCLEANFCKCNTGYSGEDCSNVSCEGVNYCSGDCILPNTCECYPGFDGAACNTTAKPNVHTPVFAASLYNASVLENSALGTKVLQVHANDADTGRNAQLLFSIDSSNGVNLAFTIDSISGEILTSSVFDYESYSPRVFKLKIMVSDNGTPRKSSSVFTYIHIVDVNDNCPIFNSAPTNWFQISQHTSPGTLLTKVSATDNDSGLNGEIRYSISTSSNFDKAFSVGGENGVLSVTGELRAKKYALVVVARDLGVPACSRQIDIKVNVFPESEDTEAPITTAVVSSTVLCLLASKRIAKKLDLDERVNTTARREAFITLKDHKPNFANNLTCRLINPAKSEIGKISKQILDRINRGIVNHLNLNQCKNAKAVSKWFNNITNKEPYSFIAFDVVDFYPSISVDLLNTALEFASGHVSITDEERNIILHTKKSLLYSEGEPWGKRTSADLFDVTMGSYDGAESCEVVGCYLLYTIKEKHGHNFGLYRDDGLGVIRESPRKAEIIKKDLCRIFERHGLKITIEANKKVVNLLDVTLNLNNDVYSSTIVFTTTRIKEIPPKSWYQRPGILIGMSVGGFVIVIIVLSIFLTVLSRRLKGRYVVNRKNKDQPRIRDSRIDDLMGSVENSRPQSSTECLGVVSGEIKDRESYEMQSMPHVHS